MQLRITNIKYRFRIKPFAVSLTRYKAPEGVTLRKRGSNFISLKTALAYYIIFSSGGSKSGDVNICGSQRLQTMYDAQREVYALIFPMIERPAKLPRLKIDNIALSGTLTGPPIRDFYRFLLEVENLFPGAALSYCPLRFTGGAIKLSIGTLVLFSSGRFNLMGLRKLKHIKTAAQCLNRVEALRQGL